MRRPGRCASRRRRAASRADAGLDPIEVRKKAKDFPAFRVLAAEVLASKTHGLRHDKSVKRWKRSLQTYAAPLDDLAVDAIDKADVLKILKPIWTAKPVTAQFVRVAIEAVLDAPKAKGFRTTDNPARLRGHLDHLLAKRPKLSRGHHAAMPYADVPGFIAELRQREAVAALALEYLILTAARAGEIRGARWSEIDLESRPWTIPAERMKAGREHRVPLPRRAIEILGEMGEAKTGAFVFPGQPRGKVVKDGAPLSAMAFDSLLGRMKRDTTTHGFRSSFRDWAGEVSTFPRELAEAALAHVVGDTTERGLSPRRRAREAAQAHGRVGRLLRETTGWFERSPVREASVTTHEERNERERRREARLREQADFLLGQMSLSPTAAAALLRWGERNVDHDLGRDFLQRRLHPPRV